MRSTTVIKIAGVAAGIAALAFVVAVLAPAWANSRTGEPRRPASEVKTTLPQDADLFQQPNPLGLRSLASTEQFAEGDELHRNAVEIDAEVGAGEQEVLTTPVAANQPGSGGGWMEQALITTVVLAALGVTLGLVFMPGDRIPRIGYGPGHSDG
jgi:hypothetical protein